MKTLSKIEANKQLQKLQNEMDKLKEIINKPIDLFKTINTYTDVCDELGIKEKVLADFDSIKEYRFHQIQNIAKLFNGESTRNYYYPYFTRTGSGLVYYSSSDGPAFYFGTVALYKDYKTAEFIGKKFIEIYTDLDN